MKDPHQASQSRSKHSAASSESRRPRHYTRGTIVLSPGDISCKTQSLGCLTAKIWMQYSLGAHFQWQSFYHAREISGRLT